MTERPEELINEFTQAGFPPIPRNDISYTEDEYNFKKAIIVPREPIEIVKDEKGELHEIPCYTSTMALGNLSTNEVDAERDDWRIARIADRYGYSNIVKSQYYAITDRVIATQAHQATMLAAVTVQQYGMRRVESTGKEEDMLSEESGVNPIAKLITAIKGAPSKGAEMSKRGEENAARYRV